MKRLLTFILAVCILCTTPVFASESSLEGADTPATAPLEPSLTAPTHDPIIMTDPQARYDHVPTSVWSWSTNGSVYSGDFQYHSYTYTNYCFKLNSSNKLYYSIVGECGAAVDCGVYCYSKDTNELLSSYTFTTVRNTKFEAHRVITVPSNYNVTDVYLKLTNSSGWAYFTGVLKVSNAYV